MNQKLEVFSVYNRFDRNEITSIYIKGHIDKEICATYFQKEYHNKLFENTLEHIVYKIRYGFLKICEDSYGNEYKVIYQNQYDDTIPVTYYRF